MLCAWPPRRAGGGGGGGRGDALHVAPCDQGVDDCVEGGHAGDVQGPPVHAGLRDGVVARTPPCAARRPPLPDRSPHAPRTRPTRCLAVRGRSSMHPFASTATARRFSR